ncbi:hypothetical protein EMCRGX_G027757 [Ephydatia muelleri]
MWQRISTGFDTANWIVVLSFDYRRAFDTEEADRRSPEEQVKVGVVKEPQRDNDTGLQVVIKELAERLGNLDAKIQSVALRSDGAEARSWERKPRDAGQKQQYRSTSDRLSPTCYLCGKEGHIKRYCPLNFNGPTGKEEFCIPAELDGMIEPAVKLPKHLGVARSLGHVSSDGSIMVQVMNDAYPLPRIDVTLELLARSALFTTLDLASGYWQVEIEEGDKEKTAFSTEKGHFEFNVMPFGLTNAPCHFPKADGVCLSWTYSEHLDRLERVFLKLQGAGLKLRSEKCHFVQKAVKYLGHVVYDKGICPDPAKTDVVANYPIPKNAKGGNSEIAAPLSKLLSKENDKCFTWTSSCQAAFEDLKSRLVAPPILAYPNFQLQFLLYTDASDSAIGAVLSQMQEGQERVIAYWSRKLQKTERNYSTTEREALAVVSALKEFYPYVYGFSCVAPGLKWTFLHDGLLCRQFRASSSDCVHTQLVVPASFVEKILHQLHDESGHLGVQRTKEKVKERFYWPGYEADIEHWIHDCQCARSEIHHNRSP